MSNPQPTLPTPAAEYGASARRWNWRRALAPTGSRGDAVFRVLLFLIALLILLTLGAMIVEMASNSMLSLRAFGTGFLVSRTWDPIKGEFGALPFIYGTVASSIIALIIAVPLSLGVAIFLVEQAASSHITRPIAFLVE